MMIWPLRPTNRVMLGLGGVGLLLIGSLMFFLLWLGFSL
jgi:hypothetical protein